MRFHKSSNNCNLNNDNTNIAMQNSDLKNVLISAIETADNRLLSMLYAVTKSYQITETKSVEPVQEAPVAEPVAALTERRYKDERPRRVVRIYRKPQEKVIDKVVEKTPVVAPRVVRISAASRAEAQPSAADIKETTVSGRSNNGGFITDLMTKTVSKSALPA